MKIHPGCGLSTQFMAKFIAICDLVFGLIGVFWFIYILESYGLLMEDPSIYNPANHQTFTPKQQSTTILSSNNLTSLQVTGTNDTIIVATPPPLVSVTNDGIQIHGKNSNIILSGFYTLVNLVAFVLLLSAAHEKNILKLKIWFAIRLTIFVFKIVLYTFYFMMGAPIFTQAPHVIFMAIHLYGLWVVAVFIKEIRAERKSEADMEGIDEASTNGHFNPTLRLDEEKS